MRKRSKIFIILMIVVLALVALALEMLIHPQLKYFLTKPATYGQCVEAGGRIMESYPTQCAFDGQTFVNPDQKVSEPSVDTGLKGYEDKTAGYSFQYPTDIFVQTQTQQQFPFFDKTDLRAAVVLTHEIPVPHCDLADGPQSCEPTTKNIVVTFMPLDMTFADGQASMSRAGVTLEDISLGQLSAKTMMQGAEGEGVHYYLVSMPNNKSLLIMRTFIDEGAILTYQNAPAFIKRVRQDQLFNDIAATLKIGVDQAATGPSLAKLASDTSGWETFTNNTRGYSIKYPKNWIIEPVNIALDEAKQKPVRYLKFTSPDKEYLLTVGIKLRTEDVWLGGPSDVGRTMDLQNRSSLQVAGVAIPITANNNSNTVIDIFYYDNVAVKDEPGIAIKNYFVRAEFTQVEGFDTNLENVPELAIANSILASLVLTK